MTDEEELALLYDVVLRFAWCSIPLHRTKGRKEKEMKQHVKMEAHDGYAAHSHEVRADHRGVPIWCDYHDIYHYPPSPNCVMFGEKRIIEVDPTELLPGDVVVKLGDHEISGCHCDVRVTVERRREENRSA